MRGAKGDAYHSNYDTLAWYRQVVGNEYESALAVSRVTSLVLARLANSDLVQLDPAWYARDTVRHAENVLSKTDAAEYSLALNQLRASAAYLGATVERLQAISDPENGPEVIARFNRALLKMESHWLNPECLPGLPWFRNTFAISDPTSGYAAWMLPELRMGVENEDPEAIRAALLSLSHRLDDIRQGLEEAMQE